jgi:hypothetical protein
MYLEIIDGPSGCLRARFWGKNNFEFALFFDYKVGAAILVTKGVTADNDGLFPSGDETRDTRDDNGFTKDCAVENVSDSPVGRSPHLFQVEFCHYQYNDDKAGEGSGGGPLTRASSGVMVAHLIPTLYFWIACAASIVT